MHLFAFIDMVVKYTFNVTIFFNAFRKCFVFFVNMIVTTSWTTKNDRYLDLFKVGLDIEFPLDFVKPFLEGNFFFSRMPAGSTAKSNICLAFFTCKNYGFTFSK